MNSPSGVNASGPLIELDDLHLLERRDAHDRVLHQLLEARPVLLEQLAVEVGGDPVERPRGAVPLVAAHDQAARLGPEVDEQRGVAHRRHVERQAGRLRARGTRGPSGSTGTVTPASAPISPANMPPALTTISVSIVAAVGLDRGDAPALASGSPVTRVCVFDLGAAPPRALGERERQLARVDVAVGREDTRRRARRRSTSAGRAPAPRRARSSSSGRPNVFAQPAWRAISSIRSSDDASRSEPDLAPAGLEPDLGLERPVEVDALHHHLRQRERRAELADEAGRVERRAAREVGPLDEDDVVPAEPREPVEDRAAADAAADHHRSRPVPHRISSVSPSAV